MLILSGKAVCKGIVQGKITVVKQEQQVKRIRVRDTQAEIVRLRKALEKTRDQLQRLYDKAVKEVGETSAGIFATHQMMLEDEDYLEAICNMIHTEQVNAEYGAAVTGDNFSKMFAAMEDEYMRARATDIADISNRLIRNLTGEEEMDFAAMEPSIIVADDLSPSETIQMDKEKILAIVMVHGCANSHTAILARSMNIPALVSIPIDLEKVHTGMWAVVDGFRGEMILEPTEEICGQATARVLQEKEQRELLETLKGTENVTLDGHKINIYANINSVAELGYVLENDAGGIGLFRSEFLYLGKEDFPSEEEQFEAYKQVVRTMARKTVIIRTIDIGADKQAEYFHLGKEENPAMGYRGIRICLKQPEIFKTQLRALFRAAVFGNLAVMYPMITSTEEVERVQQIVEQVQTELEQENIPFRVPEQGIMIETPAAVMVSDELAQMVDFFSIGTNDLTQYTLAIDRQNDNLDEFYNAHHKAILKMIQIVADNAHKAGKWVGICGELGADTSMTETLVRMGIDEFSVTPAMVLKIRKIVREMRMEEMPPEELSK